MNVSRELQERIDALIEFGYPLDRARYLATNRTIAQIRHWIGRSARANDPHAYFAKCHIGNAPAPSELPKSVPTAADPDAAFKAKRTQSMRDTLAAVLAGEWDAAEDTYENRFELLKRFGFYERAYDGRVIDLSASELAAPVTMRQILQILRDAEPEPFPRAYARRELEWAGFYNRRPEPPFEVAKPAPAQPWRGVVRAELEVVRATIKALPAPEVDEWADPFADMCEEALR